VNGIHSLIDVPKGQTYNTDFFCHVVMPSLIDEVTRDSRRKTLKGFVIHMDNARPHNSRRSQECIKAPSAQRSPDLAPSDFFLFGCIKEKLTNFNCETRDILKDAIIEIFNGIEKETFVAVFAGWMKQLKWVIEHEGAYYHK
jgi:hypothetical protein